jgi:hypothetical protein
MITHPQIVSLIAEIRKSIAEAERTVTAWECRESDQLEQEVVEYYIEKAFIQTKMLVEAIGLDKTLSDIQQLDREAKKDYAKTEYAEGLYSYWAGKLRPYLDGLSQLVEPDSSKRVSKDIIEILRGTQYSVTDQRCFDHPPSDESELHVRVEAILRCVFPDLLSKPPLAKPIKNFIPDTGVPSLQALIEYKFVESEDDVKRVADEVLADTRGYVSKEWKEFIYLIYETRRLRSERQWMDLLRACGLGQNTAVVVISGEAKHKGPNKKLTRAAKRRK